MAQIYGSVGGSLGNAQFDKGRTFIGQKGERQTADLLAKYFKNDSDVAIFHDLKVPNLDRANIDHVIIKGKTIFVIDSKWWKGGTYWKIGKTGFRGFKLFNPLVRFHVEAAVTHFSKKFPDYKVKGVVAVWGKGTHNFWFRSDTKYIIGKNLGGYVKSKSDKGRLSQETVSKVQKLLIK